MDLVITQDDRRLYSNCTVRFTFGMYSANSNCFSAATCSRQWMRRLSLPAAMWLPVLWQK